MWIDIGQGYLNEDHIEFIELIDDVHSVVCIHTGSGKKIKIQGVLANNIIIYARNNNVSFVNRVQQPLGLSGDLT